MPVKDSESFKRRNKKDKRKDHIKRFGKHSAKHIRVKQAHNSKKVKVDIGLLH